MSVAIQLGFIHVGAVQTDSGVFMGENQQNGWDSHAKQNIAGSSVIGDYNYVMMWNNLLFDPDIIDVPINDQDIKSPSYANIMGV